MPRLAASILTTVVLVLTLGAANAQEAQEAPPKTQERTLGYYRCGPQGQELRDSPCPDGPGRAVALPKDEVDPKEAAAARRRTAAETRELASRQREHDRHAAKAPSTAAGIDGRLAAQKGSRPSKPADPKKPKPKDPKKPPKKKPKLPKSPEPALPPTPTISTAAPGHEAPSPR